MTRDAETFRKQAEECRRQVEKAVSPLDREAWLRAAYDYLKLAKENEGRDAK